MVFKELEIQGFKSFPDKVKITFDAGVTGVVGPNGSGKSNLSDAVRWVLGETSSRQLRAAGKMEDVIFGGTRRRSAMGFASVRLTLDNTGHTLDVDADEVTIGRKYYRSGDSEYTINGQVCRLRDVYELLLDTGIGRDGYSVIGQGRIAEIVAAKSSERREIFEEACGIAKYRYRKTEAERRLAAAGENLERLRDILGELESRVGPLEKESAKAQKFLELSEQRKTLEVTLWTDSVHRARDAVRQQVRDYETAQADYERFDGEAKAAEQEAEEIRMQAQQLTIAVERLNGDIRSITEQISGSDSRIAVLENDILRNEESIASLRSEIEAGEQDGAEADAALQRHRAVAAKMEAEGEKLAAEIDALNAELEQLADASNASGARKDTLRAEITDLTAKRTEAQVAQAAAEAAEETARQRLPALEQAVQEGTDQWETARQDLTDTIRYREMLTENEKQLANVRSGLELKLKNRKAALDEADTAEQRLGRELDAARQRLSVLRGGFRSLVPVLAGVCAAVLFCQLSGIVIRYDGQLRDLRANSSVRGNMTDISGKYTTGLVLNEQVLDQIGQLPGVSELTRLTATPYYFAGVYRGSELVAGPGLPPQPTTTFESERYMANLSSGPDLVFIDRLEGAPEFMYSTSIETQWLEGYDSSCFQMDWDASLDPETAENRCVISTDMMDQYGIRLGDWIWLEVRCSDAYSYSRSQIGLRVVGAYTQTGRANNIYTNLSMLRYPYAYDEDLELCTLGGVYLAKSISGATFKIADCTDLTAVKQALYDMELSAVGKLRAVRNFVIINDAAYLNTERAAAQRLWYMQHLFPVVYAIALGLAYLIAFLQVQSRRKELRTMRSVGADSRTAYWSLYWEQLMLAALGAVLGAGLCLALGWGTALGLGLTAAFAVLWLLGAHVALRRANSRHILKNRREVE